jgi:tubulin polyglutamylase TTLL5
MENEMTYVINLLKTQIKTENNNIKTKRNNSLSNNTLSTLLTTDNETIKPTTSPIQPNQPNSFLPNLYIPKYNFKPIPTTKPSKFPFPKSNQPFPCPSTIHITNHFKTTNKFPSIKRNLSTLSLNKHHSTNPTLSTHSSSHSNLPIFKHRYLNFRPYIDIPPSIQPKPNNHNFPCNYYYKIIGNDVPLIRNFLEDNGFIEDTSHQSSLNAFTILWSTLHIKPSILSSLTKYQKVNHFPLSNELTRKDLLYKNISKYKALFPGVWFNFIPESFLLPNEHKYLEDTISQSKHNDTLWIVKPFSNCQGKGIFLTKSISSIPFNQRLIVSKYITNPYLINNKKFDLRIYVLLTSLHPLRIYRYNDGLVRFCVNNYNNRNYTDKYSHLTNYAINKHSKHYIPNTNISETDTSSSKWNLLTLRNHFTSQGIDSDIIFNKIDDMIIKSIISCENQMWLSLDKNAAFPQYNCIALFGYDILIDEYLNPWLLEVNHNPNLHYDTPIDLKIKGEMIAEMFNIMRIVPYDLRGSKYERKFNLNNVDVFNDEEFKCMVYNKFKITKEIKEMIWNSVEEEKRCNKFIKLFPCWEYFKYQKFFDKEKDINVILGVIEMERQRKIKKGV